jgi:hypothetical protein
MHTVQPRMSVSLACQSVMSCQPRAGTVPPAPWCAMPAVCLVLCAFAPGRRRPAGRLATLTHLPLMPSSSSVSSSSSDDETEPGGAGVVSRRGGEGRGGRGSGPLLAAAGSESPTLSNIERMAVQLRISDRAAGRALLPMHLPPNPSTAAVRVGEDEDQDQDNDAVAQPVPQPRSVAMSGSGRRQTSTEQLSSSATFVLPLAVSVSRSLPLPYCVRVLICLPVSVSVFLCVIFDAPTRSADMIGGRRRPRPREGGATAGVRRCGGHGTTSPGRWSGPWRRRGAEAHPPP